MQLPKSVEYIIGKFALYGYKAYVVGGCVRDYYLGRSPKDWDIATNCRPEKMLEIFVNDKVIETGIRHGTLTIVVDGENIEVTTFRIDGEYSDGRRPDDVRFTNFLREDLARRDFTINAMAYNHDDGLIDYFGGIDDLGKKRIKCVGSPNSRFSEDALRMLRAVRFSAQLGFRIEPETSASIFCNADLLKNISAERKSAELNKILLSNPLKMQVLADLDLIQYILPELEFCVGFNQYNPYHIYDVYSHSYHAAAVIEGQLRLRLAMMLHDIAKPSCFSMDKNFRGHFFGHPEKSAEMAVKVLRNLRYDNLTIMRVRDLVLYHDAKIGASKKNIRKWLGRIGEETFRDLLKVKEADIKAQNPKYYQHRHNDLVKTGEMLNQIIEAKECFGRKDLAINGSDLMAIGFEQGRELGVFLDELVDLVIANPEMNNREDLLCYSKFIK